MYQLWTVFEESRTQYYVVNMQTKEVQSVWATLLVGRATCAKLNQDAKRAL